MLSLSIIARMSLRWGIHQPTQLIDLEMRIVLVNSLFLFSVPHWVSIPSPTPILTSHRYLYAICTRPNNSIDYHIHYPILLQFMVEMPVLDVVKSSFLLLQQIFLTVSFIALLNELIFQQ
mgnify:CR=1 FL=1